MRFNYMDPIDIYNKRIQQAIQSAKQSGPTIPGNDGTYHRSENIFPNIEKSEMHEWAKGDTLVEQSSSNEPVNMLMKDDAFKYRGNVLKGQLSETLLSQAFFSSPNIKIIQNGIRKGVFDASSGNFLIDEQNEMNLLVIMRSIFYQEAKHLPDFIPEQIAELNQKVIAECIPRMMTNVKQYNQYLIDRSVPHLPLSQPLNVSSKGTKTYDLSSINNMR